MEAPLCREGIGRDDMLEDEMNWEEEEYKDFGSDEEKAEDEEVFQEENIAEEEEKAPDEEVFRDEEAAQDEEVFEEEIMPVRKRKDLLDILMERVWVTDPKNLREELYSVFIRTYVKLARKNEKLRDLEPEVEAIRPYSDEYPEEILRSSCCDVISEISNIARGIRSTEGKLLVAIGELILQLEKEGKIRIGEYDDKRVCSIIVSIINNHTNEWSRIEDPEGSVKRLISIVEGDIGEGD